METLKDFQDFNVFDKTLKCFFSSEMLACFTSTVPSLPYVCFLFHPSEDDVDLEALVNDMNSSLESLYSSCSGQQTESTPLLQQNGQSSCSHHHHTHNNQPLQLHTSQVLTHVSPEPLPSSSFSSTADPPQTGLRRSQPMHILAVRLVALDFLSCFLSGGSQVCIVKNKTCSHRLTFGLSVFEDLLDKVKRKCVVFLYIQNR